MYARWGAVTVYYHDRDNTLVGSSKYTNNAYNHLNKVAKITKA